MGETYFQSNTSYGGQVNAAHGHQRTSGKSIRQELKRGWFVEAPHAVRSSVRIDHEVARRPRSDIHNDWECKVPFVENGIVQHRPCVTVYCLLMGIFRRFLAINH
jgi:hypothetical protein